MSLRLALLLCLPAACLLPAAPAEPPPAVFRVLALAMADGLHIDGNRGAPRPVSASAGRFSSALPVPRDGVVELYRIRPSDTPGGPPQRESVIRATLPATPGAESLLLLLPREGPPNSDAYRPALRAAVIDLSSAAHPADRVRVFNLSTRETALQLDGDPVRIQPGHTALVPLPGTEKPWISTAVLGPEGWRRVTGAPLTLRPGHRLTLFMVDPPTVGEDGRPTGLSLFRIVDRPSSPAPDPARP